MLGSVGKFLTVSLKAHFNSIVETGGGTSGGIICDPSEADSKIYNFTAVSYLILCSGRCISAVTWLPERFACLALACCHACTGVLELSEKEELLRRAMVRLFSIRRGCTSRDNGAYLGR
jgi:hypothetical protein|eukprot:COSAG02_NODE_3343_length_6898_cov_9.593617_8_plen_119_part_00